VSFLLFAIGLFLAIPTALTHFLSLTALSTLALSVASLSFLTGAFVLMRMNFHSDLVEDFPDEEETETEETTVQTSSAIENIAHLVALQTKVSRLENSNLNRERIATSFEDLLQQVVELIPDLMGQVNLSFTQSDGSTEKLQAQMRDVMDQTQKQRNHSQQLQKHSVNLYEDVLKQSLALAKEILASVEGLAKGEYFYDLQQIQEYSLVIQRIANEVQNAKLQKAADQIQLSSKNILTSLDENLKQVNMKRKSADLSLSTLLEKANGVTNHFSKLILQSISESENVAKAVDQIATDLSSLETSRKDLRQVLKPLAQLKDAAAETLSKNSPFSNDQNSDSLEKVSGV